MNSMGCNQFEKSLEQLAGPLSASAAEHLEDCAPCRLLWNDIEAIRNAAQAWGAETPPPPARLWTSLRVQLENEGLIHAAPPPLRLTGWLSLGPRLAMAGAYLSLLLVGAILLSVRTGSPAQPLSGPARVTRSVQIASVEAELGRTLDSDMKSVMAALPERNSSLATSLQQNLGIVDNMIALCEKSVREQPGDPLAREYLYGAYQQKAVLLATALDRSTLEEK